MFCGCGKHRTTPKRIALVNARTKTCGAYPGSNFDPSGGQKHHQISGQACTNFGCASWHIHKSSPASNKKNKKHKHSDPRSTTLRPVPIVFVSYLEKVILNLVVDPSTTGLTFCGSNPENPSCFNQKVEVQRSDFQLLESPGKNNQTYSRHSRDRLPQNQQGKLQNGYGSKFSPTAGFSPWFHFPGSILGTS